MDSPPAIEHAMAWWIAAPLAAASGLALWLSFPAASWWALAPVGVAGLALATRGQRPRRAAWLGLVSGLAYFAPHLHWSGIYVGDLPWLALSTLEAAYLALLGALLPFVWRAGSSARSAGRGSPAPAAGALAAVGIGALWVGQEALRSRTPFGGFPWGRLAFSQSDAPSLGYAALGGAPAVTAVVAVAGGLLAVAVVMLSGARRSPRPYRTVVAAGVAVLLAVGIYAGGALVPRPTGADRSLQVAAVQGSVPRAGLDFNAQRRAVLDNHAGATRELADAVAAGTARPPEVVLWPENSSDIDPFLYPDAAAAIQSAVDRIGVPVLVGAVLEQPVGRLSNAGIIWQPSGAANPGPSGDYYVKRHPAPFGEYIPLRSFFRIFSDKVDLVQRDFVSGTRVGVLPAAGARLGDIICFEVAYDGLVRDSVRAGADLLVVQTNNATFGYTDESVQQLAMSRLRAVEAGRAVVHISTVGVSSLIMPDGALVQPSALFTKTVLQGALPLRTERTWATRLGGWPEAVLCALGLLVVAAGVRRSRGSAQREMRWQ